MDETPPRPRNARLKGMAICDFVLRTLELMRDAGDGDLERFAIYLAVVSAGAGRHTRDPEIRKAYADAPLPDDMRTPVSRRAIAASLGIPRETVRRKVAELIAMGDLTERDGGVVATAPVLERRNNPPFVTALDRECRRISEQLDRLDTD
jgi:hypothetical protein